MIVRYKDTEGSEYREEFSKEEKPEHILTPDFQKVIKTMETDIAISCDKCEMAKGCALVGKTNPINTTAINSVVFSCDAHKAIKG